MKSHTSCSLVFSLGCVVPGSWYFHTFKEYGLMCGIWSNIAGIFKCNFNNFLLETVWNGKESGEMCGSRTWLTCSILCKIYTGFKLVSLKSLNSQQFPQQSVSSDEMSHLMQFSEAAHELCMVHCVLLDCKGTKWKGNVQTIPAGSCSQQLWGETNF